MTLHLEDLPLNKPTRSLFDHIQEIEHRLMDLDELTKAQDNDAVHQFNEIRKSSHFLKIDRDDIRRVIGDKEKASIFPDFEVPDLWSVVSSVSDQR